MKKVFLAIFVLMGIALTAAAQESKTMYVMKNGEVAYQSAVSEIDSVIFYAPEVSPVPEGGVFINGVIWATCNIDAPGTFAAKPEDPGMLYQWNRKIGWSATDPMINSNGGSAWDNSYPTGTTWEKANDPSPAGYRVPTLEEIQSLLNPTYVNNEWTTQNGVTGRKFTDRTTGSSLFLPAAGYRGYYGGALSNAGEVGSYWSSSQAGSSRAYSLNFGSGNADWGSTYLFGFSVRSVAE